MSLKFFQKPFHFLHVLKHLMIFFSKKEGASFGTKVGIYFTFGVVSFGPIIARSGLPIDVVIRTEQSSKMSSSHGIHGSRFQIRKNGSWNVLVIARLIIIHLRNNNQHIRYSSLLQIQNR